MREWLKLACDRRVVRRGLGYAVVVGAVLIAINHGGAIMRGDFTRGRVAEMLLTIAVPYVVSTASSVGAMRESRRSGDPTDATPSG